MSLFRPTADSFHCENSSVLNLCISDGRNSMQVLSEKWFSWTSNWICCFSKDHSISPKCMHFDAFCFLTVNLLIETLPQPRKSQSSLYQQESLPPLLLLERFALHTRLYRTEMKAFDLWTSLLSRKETKAWINFLFLASFIFLFCFELRWTLSNHRFIFFFPQFFSFLSGIYTYCTSRELYSCFYWVLVNLKELHYSHWWNMCTNQPNTKISQ